LQPVLALSDLQFAICILSLMIAPLAVAGLALMNTGLGRSRNAAHSMMAAMCAISIAASVWFVCGRAFQGYGGAGPALMLAGKPWNWIGAEAWFFRSLPMNGSPAFLTAWFGMLSVTFAAVIPLGSGADRWRLGAICGSTAILAGWTFPLFSHWTWGGGWLTHLGTNYGLGRGFLDTGGAGSIHAVGGLTALAIAWILGPRRGKYTPEGMPMAIPGHNAVLVAFGCLAAFAGWLGFIAAGAILFAGVESGRVVLIGVNTLLSASAAAVAAALITKLRFTKPDASLTANGWIGGLVASSATAAFVPPAAEVLVGLVTGALVVFAVELIDLRFDIDDPTGTISVHFLGGITGLLAVGIFGRIEAGGEGQLLAQLVGIATLIGFVLPLTYGLNALMNLVLPQRVAAEGEHHGMDLHELGAGAYPEFMTHTDDFLPR
jgi:Amt family ammonium transporter